MAVPVPRTTGVLPLNPFAEIDRIREDFDRLARSFPGDGAEGGFVPSADVEETDDAFVVDIELPGVDRRDVDIELAGRRLSVTGERKEKERTGVLRRTTRTVGRFRYELTLPSDVDPDACDASFDDGVLTVRVPKVETDKPKRIEVS